MSKINHKFTLSMALCAQILTINLNVSQAITNTLQRVKTAKNKIQHTIFTNKTRPIKSHIKQTLHRFFKLSWRTK